MKRALLIFLTLGGMLAVWAYAQNTPVTAGGKWQEFDSKDPMTDVPKVRFELEADNFLHESVYHKPKAEIFCDDGKYKFADFAPNVRIGPPNRPGFWGQPQLEVEVRIDDRHDSHGWNWIEGRFLSMDKGTVRGLIGAKIFKIEFRTPDGDNIAEFSPAGLDLNRFSHACGLSPK